MALMLNKVRQRPGHCAVCGGTNLDYGSYDIDGDQIQYPWVCTDCHAEGVEWASVTFLNHDIRIAGDKLLMPDR